MKRHEILLLSAIIVIIIISFIGSKGELVENLGIPVGVGLDIEKSGNFKTYSLPFLTYLFDENTVASEPFLGKASNIPETRENRQLESPKKTLIGLNRIFIFSEDFARDGIKNFIEINVNNSQINDRCLCVVCSGKAEDMLMFKPTGYSSSAEFLEGMTKDLQQFNFFSMQFTLMDLIVRIDAEGRNFLLPYIIIDNNKIKTTGLAIFNKDKMVGIANIDETRVINILKENNVNGILTLQASPNQYISSYTSSKRKIKCTKLGDAYSFTIDLKLKGNIISNQLYRDLYISKTVQRKFEADMEKYVENLCNQEINKITKEYKTDVLDLGRVAASKYGKDTGADWNKVICKSSIKVNVRFTADTEGRGSLY